MPSDLCNNTYTQWNTHGDIAWNNGECGDVKSEYFSNSVINNKQWIYQSGDTVFVMDYLFTVNNIHNGFGRGGVMIYHFGTICNYYFVGISVDDSNIVRVFIDKYFNDIDIILYESPALLMYELGKYYVMRVKLMYTTNIGLFSVVHRYHIKWLYSNHQTHWN